MKIVRAEVHLTEDRSTFIGYHYYLQDEKSRHAFKLYSSFKENALDLSAENQHDPKDWAYHDRQAKVELEHFMKKLRQSTQIAIDREDGEDGEIDDSACRNDLMTNKKLKSF